MSAIETAALASQRLERILEQRFGARGHGLGMKLSSVESQVPRGLARNVRWIARVRNRVLHDGGDIDDLESFERAVDETARRLEVLPPGPKLGAWLSATLLRRRPDPGPSGPGRLIAVAMIIALVFAIFIQLRLRGSAAHVAPMPPAEFAVAAPVPQPPATAASEAVTRELKGSLADLAREASADLVAARRDVDTHVWSYIKENTRITLGEPELHDHGDGTHDLRVKVGFVLDGGPVIRVLQKYLTLRSGKIDFADHMGPKVPGISLRDWDNQAARQKKAFSASLYRDLTSRQARIRVFAGRHSAALTIASGRECSVSCSDVGTDQFQIHVDNRAKPDVTLLPAWHGEQNPVVISRIPSAELASIGKLTAVVETTGRPASLREKLEEARR